MKHKKKIHGFNVPSDYFESLDSKILEAVQQSVFPIKEGFKIPEGYFNSIEEKVEQQLKVDQNNEVLEKKETKIISLFNKNNLKYALAAAASFVLIFSLLQKNETNMVDWNSVSQAKIEEYVEDGNLNLTSQEVAQLLTNEGVLISSFENLDLNTENIENYLLESDINNSLLNY